MEHKIDRWIGVAAQVFVSVFHGKGAELKNKALDYQSVDISTITQDHEFLFMTERTGACTLTLKLVSSTGWQGTPLELR